MMPGFIEPKRNLVFNEKTWRYVHVDQPVDIADDKLDDLLEEFNGNLQNVGKIYKSIARSFSKEDI